MAIYQHFETTKERLDGIFRAKKLNPGLAKPYFQGMYPTFESNMARPDIISGCVKFINETIKENDINTYNFHIDIDSDYCTIVCTTKAYSFPKIVISNYKSQYMTIKFVPSIKESESLYTNDQVYSSAMIGLSEALAIYYNQAYRGERII